MSDQKSESPDQVTFFDPEGCTTAPYTTAVEILLGGVGRLMFPDGTQQFADAEVQPALIYSHGCNRQRLSDSVKSTWPSTSNFAQSTKSSWRTTNLSP